VAGRRAHGGSRLPGRTARDADLRSLVGRPGCPVAGTGRRPVSRASPNLSMVRDQGSEGFQVPGGGACPRIDSARSRPLAGGCPVQRHEPATGCATRPPASRRRSGREARAGPDRLGSSARYSRRFGFELTPGRRGEAPASGTRRRTSEGLPHGWRTRRRRGVHGQGSPVPSSRKAARTSTTLRHPNEIVRLNALSRRKSGRVGGEK